MRTPLAALVLFLCTDCLCIPDLAQDRSLTLYTSLAPTESGLLAQAFEKEAARAFVDFVLSPEGQELLASIGRVPASTKVRTHLSDFEYTVVDPITVLDEQDKWNKLWEELFIRREMKR